MTIDQIYDTYNNLSDIDKRTFALAVAPDLMRLTDVDPEDALTLVPSGRIIDALRSAAKRDPEPILSAIEDIDDIRDWLETKLEY